MKILVIGAGAIGGITAAMMKENGYEVTLVCKYPELVKKIEETGIRIFGYCGDRTVRMNAVAKIDDLNEEFDVVFIATKATELADAATDVLHVIKPDSLVVSMQNGIVEEELARIVGNDRTVGCVVGFGATMFEPGVLEMTSRGEMVIGYLDGEKDDKLSSIAEMLGSVVPTTISENILSNLYSKLIVNSGSSTLGAISGMTLGRMLKIKRARYIFLAIIREAVEVANAMDLKIIPYAGKVNWYNLAYGPKWLSHILIRLYGIKYRKLKSSSLQSLERGKKTEVDIFNGYIAGKGSEYNVPTPANSLLVKIVHEIEDKERPSTKSNLHDKGFDEIV